MNKRLRQTFGEKLLDLANIAALETGFRLDISLIGLISAGGIYMAAYFLLKYEEE